MTFLDFLKHLGIATILAIGVAIGFSYIPKTAEYTLFSWILIAFFTLFSIGVYFISLEMKKNEKKGALIGFAMGVSLTKMIMAVGLIIAYNFLAEPSSKLFVFPFFVIYPVYTIFETIFLTKLSKSK